MLRPALALPRVAHRSLVALAAFAALSATRPAAAAPIELVEARRNYMVFNDVDGTVEHNNWFARDPFFVGYQAIEDGFLAVHPDDSQFIAIYTTFELPAGVGAFFQSMANDVHGIGYEHAAAIDAIIPAPYFDDTPKSQVFGFMHMNDWTWHVLPELGGLDEEWISLVFGQELGHAWLSFVRYDDGKTDLLGRALAHWSFYLQTGGSPIQGHDWVDNQDGTFTAHPHDSFQYSDLDLYLMGLMGAKEVQPWFLIQDPHDCVDSAKPDKSCAPADAFQFQAPTYTVSGTRKDFTIDDIILFEGERIPSYEDSPKSFDISFLLIKRPDEVLCEDELEAIEAVVERSIEMWVEQTRGRGALVNRTASDRPTAPAPSCTPDPSGTGGESESDGGTSGGAGTTGTSSGGDGSSSSSDGDTSAGSSGGQDDDGSCACRSDGGGRGRAIGLLAPLLLAAGRRRRR
ncbi:MAG: hypothetical protein H6710_15390 [Myxococcales bacterium]|nr:hypothetical protein [Myxococcales bacterium]MCB9701955.1 hypothetical protein [Myxococcales bacterium]